MLDGKRSVSAIKTMCSFCAYRVSSIYPILFLGVFADLHKTQHHIDFRHLLLVCQHVNNTTIHGTRYLDSKCEIQSMHVLGV